MLLAAISLSVLFWIFRTPYQPAILYRTIPAEALLVTSHSNPGDRLADLSTNSILLRMAQILDQDLGKSSSTASLLPAGSFRAFQGIREAVVACVPSRDAGGAPSWYAASWIGPWSFYARLMLFFGRIPGLSPIGQYAGWTIWGVDRPVTDSGMKLSAAIGEGILFVCLSPQFAGVRHALAAYEGLAPSVYPEKHLSFSKSSEADDTGWFRVGDHVLPFEVSEIGSTRLTIRLHFDAAMSPRTPFFETADLELPSRLLGDFPVIFAAAPMDIVRELTDNKTSPAWLKSIGELLNFEEFNSGPGAVIISIHTGKYGGGFGKAPFRMRIPSAVIMIKTSGGDASTLINRLLDRLNARYRLGLIIHPDVQIAGAHHLRILEATSDNLLAQLDPEDRIAVATCEDWLILSSNARGLAALLARMQDQTPGTSKNEWRQILEERRGAALLWIDADEGAKAFQLPLLLLSMKLSPGKETAGTGSFNNLARARTLLEAARNFRTCSLLLESDSARPVIQVNIQEDSTQVEGTER